MRAERKFRSSEVMGTLPFAPLEETVGSRAESGLLNADSSSQAQVVATVWLQVLCNALIINKKLEVSEACA